MTRSHTGRINILAKQDAVAMKISILLILTATFSMNYSLLVQASDSGDSFNKTLDRILGTDSDPRKRNRNKNTSNSLTNALFGNKIARTLTHDDRQVVVAVLERYNKRGRHTWINQNNRISYRMTIDEVYLEKKALCKSFTVTARINKRWENAPGRGCRVAQGRWSVNGLAVPKHKTDTSNNDESDHE